MFSATNWEDDESTQAPPSSKPTKAALAHGELPPGVAAAIWRGTELGSPVTEVVSAGWPELDRELPGGGWPCHAITEVLQPQPSVCEWRLLTPALRSIVKAGKTVVVVGPGRHPHLPGLRHEGLDEKHLVWIQAESPAQRLWVTEQLIKSNACGALVAWLPQARQEQIRRLQICAQANDGPVFLCRPDAARHEASAAPLRVQLAFALDWAVRVHVLKRKGPAHEDALTLSSVPGGLQAILTPRLSKPSALIANRTGEVPSYVVGRLDPQPIQRPAHTAH